MKRMALYDTDFYIIEDKIVGIQYLSFMAQVAIGTYKIINIHRTDTGFNGNRWTDTVAKDATEESFEKIMKSAGMVRKWRKITPLEAAMWLINNHSIDEKNFEL
jgi:hypothetical protein